MNISARQTYRRKLLGRSMVRWFFAGILFAIIRDKEVLDYFTTAKTILQILFFTVGGGFLFFWITSKVINKKKQKKPSR